MVFFADKNNSSFSQSNPEAYLSTRSLERRSRQSIPITETDLPVNESYIEELNALNIQTFLPLNG